MPAPKWLHAEMKPDEVYSALLKTALSRSWGAISVGEAEHQFRALVLASLQGARVSHLPPPSGQWYNLPEFSDYRADRYANEDDLFVGSTIARTLLLLVPDAHVDLFDIATIGNGPVEAWKTSGSGGDVSAVPVAVLVAAVVAGGVGLTVSAVKLIHTAGTVIDQELTRREDTKRMVELQAGAIPMVIDHSHREAAEGRAIPYNDGEKAIISNLLEVQRDVAKRQNKPLPSPFDGALDSVKGWGKDVSSTVGGAVDKVADGMAKGVESLLPVAAVAAVAFASK